MSVKVSSSLKPEQLEIAGLSPTREQNNPINNSTSRVSASQHNPQLWSPELSKLCKVVQRGKEEGKLGTQGTRCVSPAVLEGLSRSLLGNGPLHSWLLLNRVSSWEKNTTPFPHLIKHWETSVSIRRLTPGLSLSFHHRKIHRGDRPTGSQAISHTPV